MRTHSQLYYVSRYVGRALLLVSPLVAFSAPAPVTAGQTTAVPASFDLKGKVPDMEQSTSTSGLSFRVNFRGIHYRAEIDGARVERHSDDRHTIWLAMKEVVLTIKATDISGGRRSARCGPMQVTLGGQRPLWIGFDVEQHGTADAPQLKMVNTRFRLTSDNLQVGSPSWVRTSGLGMTESRVVSGIRDGVSRNAKMIEEQLLEEADELFAQLQQQLEPAVMRSLVAAR